MLLLAVQMEVSSAKRAKLTLHLCSSLPMSFMYIANRSALRAPPCGRPALIGLRFDLSLLMWI